ncbi:MAG: hypothetical protein AAGH89_16260, partial [Verrucomicrobiota bacterium]
QGGEALAFAESYLETPDEVGRAMSSLLSRDQSKSTAERADWLVENLSSEQIIPAIKSFTRNSYFGNKSDIIAWSTNLDPSPIHDIALNEMVHLIAGEENFEEAAQLAGSISDDEMREEATKYVDRRKNAARDSKITPLPYTIELN